MKIKIASSAVLYLRVSTEEQARDAYGMESQEKACRRLCDDRGWGVLEVFRDAGYSGWHDVDRPEFNRMLEYCWKNRNVNIVFNDYSRFSRDTEKALRAFRELDRRGIFTIAANNPGIDCRNAAGRTARRDELSRAEDFSDQHSEKTQARMRAAHEDGRWCRPAPLGYITIGTKDKTRSNLVPHEPEAELVRKAFELVELGHDRPADVLRILTDMGLRSKKGNKLKLTTFLRMLKNPVYIGRMSSKKWGEVQGRHQAIVDEKVFRNVQLILKGKKPVAAPYKKNREDLPLRQFLVCHRCGTRMTGSPSTGEQGVQYWYYRCRKCKKAKSIPVPRADAEFIDLLSKLQVGRSFTTEFTAILREEWNRMTATSDSLRPKLEAELKMKKESHKRLVEKYLNGDKAIERVFDEMSSQFEQEIASLESRIEEGTMQRATFDELLAFSKAMLVDIGSAWKEGSIDQKQRVQNALFPEGLKCDPEKGILNSDNDCLFNQLESFVSGKLTLVRPERFELPA